MEYTPILKQASRITFENRVLCLFSFFATGSIYNLTLLVPAGVFDQWMHMRGFEDRFIENLPLFAVAIVAALLAMFVFWILAIVSHGGLIRLVDDADQGREVSGLTGWSTGFRLLGRVFLLGLVLFVPYALVSGMITALVAAPLLLGGMEGDLTGPIIVLCGGMLIGAPLLLAGGILIDLLLNLGLRHAVLGDLTALRSIGHAWGNLRSRFKDVVVMWLLLLVITIIALGIATSLSALFQMIQGFVEGINFWGAVAVGALNFLISTLLMVIWWTFISGAWTLFYRRLISEESSQPVTLAPAPFAGGPSTEASVAPPATDG